MISGRFRDISGGSLYARDNAESWVAQPKADREDAESVPEAGPSTMSHGPQFVWPLA